MGQSESSNLRYRVINVEKPCRNEETCYQEAIAVLKLLGSSKTNEGRRSGSKMCSQFKCNKALVTSIYDPFTGEHYTSGVSFLPNYDYAVGKIVKENRLILPDSYESRIYYSYGPGIYYYKTLAQAIGSIDLVQLKASQYNWTGYLIIYNMLGDYHYKLHYINGRAVSRKRIYKQYRRTQ